MKNLIVYTHPNPVSFGNAIKEQVIAACKSMGREYVLRDLYEMGFDPVLKGSDFTGIQNGQIPLDVKVEQEHILTADIITFVYPVWWTGMPALLKGYIDRVFSYGFAYTVNDGGIVPLLKGKKVVIFNTMGTPYDVYKNNGMLGAMHKTIDLGIFQFCGMEVLQHRFFGAVPYVDDGARKDMLEEIAMIVSKIK